MVTIYGSGAFEWSPGGRLWLARNCGIRSTPHTSDMRTMVEDMLANGYRHPEPEMFCWLDPGDNLLRARVDRVSVRSGSNAAVTTSEKDVSATLVDPPRFEARADGLPGVDGE